MANSFEIKSARLNALAILIKTNDITEITNDFNQQLPKLKEFSCFPFILDLSRFNYTQELPLVEIIQLFTVNQLKIVAIQHYDENFSQLAEHYGLQFQLIIEKTKTDTTNSRQQTSSQQPTLIIDKPVRSGQQIYAENSDLIVNAMVSEGAEIIADGNILVFAPMRGRVIAGASGDINARIYIASMQAQLICIAGIYRIFDQKLPSSLYKHNVMIVLDENKLTLTAVNS